MRTIGILYIRDLCSKRQGTRSLGTITARPGIPSLRDCILFSGNLHFSCASVGLAAKTFNLCLLQHRTEHIWISFGYLPHGTECVPPHAPIFVIIERLARRLVQNRIIFVRVATRCHPYNTEPFVPLQTSTIIFSHFVMIERLVGHLL